MPTGTQAAERPCHQVTDLLLAWGNGDRAALDELLPIIHQELRRLARLQMRGERANHTLQTTALVNRRFAGSWTFAGSAGRIAHIFSLSPRLMRRILVDHARSRSYEKPQRAAAVTLGDALLAAQARMKYRRARRRSRIWRAWTPQEPGRRAALLGGLSVAETADALDISPETVMRDWRFAKVWLLRQMSGRD